MYWVSPSVETFCFCCLKLSVNPLEDKVQYPVCLMHSGPHSLPSSHSLFMIWSLLKVFRFAFSSSCVFLKIHQKYSWWRTDGNFYLQSNKLEKSSSSLASLQKSLTVSQVLCNGRGVILVYVNILLWFSLTALVIFYLVSAQPPPPQKKNLSNFQTVCYHQTADRHI